jgi:hypothetical protein
MFRRGRVWWYAWTRGGKTTRRSLHTRDEFIARLRVPSYERFLATQEILRHDPEFRRLLREHFVHRGAGWLYFILDQDAGRIKIGFSRDVRRRLKHIQVHSSGVVRLLRKVKGTHADERAWKRRFSNLNVHGEWFRAESVLLTAIEGA